MTVASTRRVHRSSHASRSAGLPLLRYGSRGEAVERMQRLLRAKGYGIAADGIFGPRTLDAVRRFQASRGLLVDGVVGPRTWAALRSGHADGPARVDHSAPPGTRLVTGYRNGHPFSLRVAPVGNGQYLSARAARSYKDLMAAARRAGIGIYSLSGFRTYAQQAALYRRYGSPRAARPGYSNHQRGLSMDFGNVGGYGSRAYHWLKNHAPRFGFVNDVRGEYWHWTFVR